MNVDEQLRAERFANLLKFASSRNFSEHLLHYQTDRSGRDWREINQLIGRIEWQLYSIDWRASEQESAN